jgi:hypothetical protein
VWVCGCGCEKERERERERTPGDALTSLRYGSTSSPRDFRALILHFRHRWRKIRANKIIDNR